MNYYIVDDQWCSSEELYHHGIKGMKWGVRRYQNADGSLTAAGKKRLSKELSKEYKRNYDSAQPFKTSEKYKKQVGEAVDKFTTVADKKRIKSAKDKWLASVDEADNAEKSLDKLAEGYGKKYYDNELRKNSDLYGSPRAKEKLYEYSVYEYGYDKARKSRPDLGKIIDASDKCYRAYMEECKKVSDAILGQYGNTKLYESQYYSHTIKDTVGDIVSSKDFNEWKL